MASCGSSECSAAARAAFAGEGSRDALPTSTIARGRLATTPPTVLELLVETGLCATRGEARRLVDQGGAYVNGVRAESIDEPIGLDRVEHGEILLRAGKKKHHRVVVE